VGTEAGMIVRRLAAILVVAASCPLALFGGALLGCATQGLTARCALDGILVSPILLAAAGMVAGLLVRGWGGLGLATLGVLLGMITIPLIATAIGNSVPIDPVQGVIATAWFLPPVLIGYGVGRVVARAVIRPRRQG